MTVDSPPAPQVDLAVSGAATRRRDSALMWIQRNRGPLIVLAVSVATYLYVTLESVAERSPLGHDESVYANRARFFTGELDNGAGFWSPYRAPGLPFVLGLVFRVTGPSGLAARLVVVAFGLLAVLLVFVLATLLVNAWSGALAAAVLVLSSGFTRFAALIFIDVPGVALALAAITTTYVCWRRGRLLPVAYVAVPLIAMAGTYIRFGVPATLGPGMAAIVLVLARDQMRHRARAFLLEAAGLAAATVAAIGCVLLVPWFTAQETAPLRAQQTFRDAKGIPVTDSVDDLVQIVWPNGQLIDFFQPAIFWIVVVGVVAATVRAFQVPSIRSGVFFGWVACLSTVVILNVQLSLLVPNYLILAFPYLAIVAGIGLAQLGELGSRAHAYGMWGVAVVGVTLAVIAAAALASRQERTNDLLDQAFDTFEAAGWAVDDIADDSCVVVTGTSPQVGWYSQCRMSNWSSLPLTTTLEERLQRLALRHEPPRDFYVVDIFGGKRQPDPVLFDDPPDYLDLVAEVGDPADGRRRYVRIFRVDPCAIEGTCP